MLRILKRPEAENDLEEIWLYIAQDNPDNADSLLDEIEETSRKLARFSSMGRNRDELHPGLKSFPVGNILFFIYRLVMVLKSSGYCMACGISILFFNMYMYHIPKRKHSYG